MPEGKEIQFQEGEYPELDGLEPGSSVKFNGSATIEDNGQGGKSLVIQSMDFETEGLATREMKKMSAQDSLPAPMEAQGSGDDF